MKRMVVSMLAAMAVMASGSMVSAGSMGMDKGTMSGSGMYQGSTSSGTSIDMSGSQSGTYSGSYGDKSSGSMSPSGAYSSSSMNMNQGFQFSRMLGRDVKSMNGERLGKIKDFVVDPNGHVFALLSRADQAGRNVAVPFEAFSSTDITGMKKDHLILNISKDQLANAPDFDQSSLADRTWREGVYHHFGVQPRWSDQGMTGTQSGTFQGGSSSYQGQSSTGSYGSQDQGFQGSQMGGQSSQPKTNY